MIGIKYIALIVSLTVLALAGCTGDGGGSENNTARGLTAADFAAASTRSLPPSEVESRLNSDSIFEWAGVDSGQTVQTDSCIENKFADSTFSRAGENTFRISINDIDLKDCYPGSSNRWMEESYVTSLYMDDVMFQDDNGSPVDLEGKDYFSITNLLPLQYSLRVYSLIKFRDTDMVETLEFRGIQTIHDVSSMNAPCTFDSILDGCRIEAVFQTTSSDPAIDSYVDKDIIDTNSLGIVDRAPYYQNGTMTFTFNDWSGTMTYGNDAYTPPAYEATNGVDTVSGTYDPHDASGSSPPVMVPAFVQHLGRMPVIPFPKID